MSHGGTVVMDNVTSRSLGHPDVSVKGGVPMPVRFNSLDRIRLNTGHTMFG